MHTAINPGKKSGVIGVILPFLVVLAPIGLVFSIISTVKSSRAGVPVSLGVIGIILNVVVITSSAFFLFIVYNVPQAGLQQRNKDTESKNHARTVAAHADEYYHQFGNYPQSVSDFQRLEASRLSNTLVVKNTGPTVQGEILYQACGPRGAKVVYISSTSNIPPTIYLGSGSAKTCR